MSGPLTEDENPYRFTGGAAEGVLNDDSQDPLRRLRTISLLRSLLSAALAVYVPSLIVYLAALAVQGTSLPNAPAMDGYVVGLVGAGAQVGYTVTVIFGVMLIPRACPRFRRSTTVLILMPVLNALVAMLALRDSKQTLKAHGVRLGWLACDYSSATTDSANAA